MASENIMNSSRPDRPFWRDVDAINGRLRDYIEQIGQAPAVRKTEDYFSKEPTEQGLSLEVCMIPQYSKKAPYLLPREYQ
jgi:hypothetical protein